MSTSSIAPSAWRSPALTNSDDARIMLGRVQNELFDLGADLATPGEDFAPSEMVLRVVQPQIDRLEAEIDAMNEQLEPLKSFILPGGSEAAARIHVARTIARRAERSLVTASRQVAVNPLAGNLPQPPVGPSVRARPAAGQGRRRRNLVATRRDQKLTSCAIRLPAGTICLQPTLWLSRENRGCR